jgi:ubiquinone/menaquinone biosynthesis C-methylase UbiE
MNDNTHKKAKQDYYVLDSQTITIQKFPASGFILDIGGGGEGVIGQLKGKQVIAIDPNRRELEEAAPGPLKIVMDVRELRFLDESFQVVTSFFTLMYISTDEHKKVFEEVYRVLEPGGRFLVWDTNIPVRTDEKEDIAVVMLKVILPDREIETGYGTKWPDKAINMEHYLDLGVEAGFSLVNQDPMGSVFYLEFLKKQNR